MDQQTKAALKHDQFVDTTKHGLEWASEHRHSVIVTGSIILGRHPRSSVGGGIFYNSRSQAASVAFGNAMQTYQSPLAEPGQPVPAGIKTYPTVVDRAKAANALFMAARRQIRHDHRRQERPLLRRPHLHRGRRERLRRDHPQAGRRLLERRSRLARQARPRPALSPDRPRPPGHRPLQPALRQAHRPPYPPASPSSSSPSSTKARTSPTSQRRSTPSSRTRTPRAPPAYSPRKNSTRPPPPAPARPSSNKQTASHNPIKNSHSAPQKGNRSASLLLPCNRTQSN